MKSLINKLLIIGTIAVAILAGTKLLQQTLKPAPQTKSVFVVEATKSVAVDARDEAFTATEKATDFLNRGDEMVVIPLTADAATEAPGRVLRFRISTQRKAFDADIKEVKEQVHKELEGLKAETCTTAFVRTDLFGTLKMAIEEKPQGKEDGFTVVILSDMIQDTSEINFITDPRLISEPES
jgi:hypothetical protein